MQRSNVNNQRNRAGGSHQSNTAACRVVGDTEMTAAKDQIAAIRFYNGNQYIVLWTDIFFADLSCQNK